jgi:hypothetical protein
MEYTKHKLPDDVTIFLNNLKEYIGEPIYFYGSIQRSDYYSGSDIDIDIFSNNVDELVIKLSHYLKTSKRRFKKVVQHLDISNKTVFGYKVYYDKNISSPIEISIYSTKDKQTILAEHSLKLNIPFYISWLLIILKFLYYTLHIVNDDYYKYYKKQLLSTCIGLPQNTFIKI